MRRGMAFRAEGLPVSKFRGHLPQAEVHAFPLPAFYIDIYPLRVGFYSSFAYLQFLAYDLRSMCTMHHLFYQPTAVKLQ